MCLLYALLHINCRSPYMPFCMPLRFDWVRLFTITNQIMITQWSYLHELLIFPTTLLTKIYMPPEQLNYLTPNEPGINDCKTSISFILQWIYYYYIYIIFKVTLVSTLRRNTKKIYSRKNPCVTLRRGYGTGWIQFAIPKCRTNFNVSIFISLFN